MTKELELDIRAIAHPVNSNVTFEKGVKEQINKIAKPRGASQSQVINALLRKALTHEGNASTPSNRRR